MGGMDSPDLALRVRHLQRLLWLALVLALLPWCAIGAGAWYLTRGRIELPGTLSARAFEVRSETGALQAELACAPQFGGSLRMRNTNAREVVYLGGEAAGGGNLTLHAKDGKILVVARDNADHRGAVTAYGQDQKPLAFMGGGVRGDGVLQTWNASGTPIGQLCTNQYGEPLLQLTAKDGHSAFEAGTREDGVTDIVLYGANAKAGALFAAGEQGGRFGLFDTNGVERVQACCCAESDTPRFEIRNASGETMARVGQQYDPPGGYFRAYSAGEHVAFYGGIDDQDGSGRISLYHPSGLRIFAACMAEDKLGCVLNTFASDGALTFIAPEQPLSGK